MRATLIINFYKQLEPLKLILAALDRQSIADYEVIIADDGSPPEIVDQLQDCMKASKLNIRHIWHEDTGFRRTVILNKAIVDSRTEHLIFIDGDCIPHKNFMEAHIADREENTTLAGRRVNLSPKLTQQVNAEMIRSGKLERSWRRQVWWDGLFGKTTHVERSYYLSSGRIQQMLHSGDVHILGCNFSVNKKDVLAINGFDERYLAWGYEESDLEERLKWNGVRMKTVKNRAIVYHMFHRERAGISDNEALFRSVLEGKEPVTQFGINRKS
ncbi:MAG: glycosyltransferase [Cyclobacteriaceae bacterium]|nr:glycosyltransferase [Cyclobacteriaceae bacterium]